MSFLDEVESFIEVTIEGGARRMSRSPLQPVELARGLARAIQDHVQVGPAGPRVPNLYYIYLSPSDYTRFSSQVGPLQAELAQYALRTCRELGLHPSGTLSVHLREDSGVRPRRFRVTAATRDVQEQPPVSAEMPSQPDKTSVMGRVQSAPSPSEAQLVAQDGRQVGLTGQVVSIGRALDNHLVVQDPRVSRYHAQVRYEQGRYVVKDLGSTNGTSVRGRKVVESQLADGDEISLGGYRLVFRLVNR